jgi:hypothetical protein
MLREVPVPTLAVSELEPVIGPERYERLVSAAAEFRQRSHIGVDFQNDLTRAAWAFLRPYLESARAYFFTSGNTSRRGSPRR